MGANRPRCPLVNRARWARMGLRGRKSAEEHVLEADDSSLDRPQRLSSSLQGLDEAAEPSVVDSADGSSSSTGTGTSSGCGAFLTCDEDGLTPTRPDDDDTVRRRGVLDICPCVRFGVRSGDEDDTGGHNDSLDIKLLKCLSGH